MDISKDTKKVHRVSKAGAKANKKKAAKLKRLEQNEALKGRNPKAFIANTSYASLKQQRRVLDKEQKRINLPVIDRSGTAIETPPYVIAVVGPPQCGKTTLIRSLIKNYTRHSINEVKGPITIVAGKKRRLTFIECNNDLNSMIDTAKVADLVLLLIDASYGFEMETFEFLNILKTHGFPKVIGVLTHLDGFKNNKKLKKTKKKFKDRFWTEIYEGAKLFYLSGVIHGKYPKVEIHNLARFISVANFVPLTWRNTHPYVYVDRFEDTTDPEVLRNNKKADRNICLYGYVRGTYLKPHMKVHIPGSGDYIMKSITSMPDPCPLPQERKKTLNEKERLIYAPMCDIGNSIIFDKDAVYINIPDNKLAFSKEVDESDEEGEGESMVKKLQNTQFSIDEKMKNSEFSLFSSKPTTIKANNTYTQIEEISDREYYDEPDMPTNGTQKVEVKEDINGRVRRKVKFVDLKKNPTEYNSDDEGDEDDSDAEEEEDEEEEEESRNEIAFDDEDDLQSDEEYYDPQNKGGNDEDEDDEEDEDEEEDEEEDDDDEEEDEEEEEYDEETGESAKWKEKMKPNFTISNNPVNLTKLIYGDDLSNVNNKNSKKGNDQDDDDFFTVRKGGFSSLKLSSDKGSAKDALDSAKYIHSTHDLKSEEIKELLKKKFVSKGELESVGAVGKNDSGDGEDQVLFGDFEDLETGKVYEAGSTQPKDSDEEDSDDEDKEKGSDDDEESSDVEKEREKNKSKKQKQIEKINAKFEEGEKDYEGELNAEARRQREINEKEFEQDDQFYRTKYEGFPIGVYVRVEFEKIPCEFSEYFDPRYPVVVGGLLSNEENLGMINVNIKKHRWHKKILKSNDPLIVSVGWRRFQTMVLYSTKDINGRNRMLKYTPEHMHCHASFYGPLTPPGTAFAAFTNSNNNQASFRVSATGTVLDLDSSIDVVKKLKLIGHPDKILKKTCFVNGMFTSRLEVAKFVGATIRTVSGIRGTIKKPLSHPEGAFRATFEDKLIPSDIVFLRTWYTVTPTKYYNPVTSLLQEKKTSWQGMKTVGQLRYENNLSAPVKKDSSYEGLKVEREQKSFKQLKIPTKLQSQLPFEAKPKQRVIKNQDDILLSSRVNIVEPHEQQVADLMKRLQTIKDKKIEKEQQRRESRAVETKKKQDKLDVEREKRQKQEKKRKSKLEALGKIKKKSKMG
ncbi:hypothetical protein DICPUDRAFT_158216 [Dictyostelium purpureum]|uniref:Bms1-type G domain-containing protein n=1 Tax=Dictyostelium purpureum TaxID=5786 RepID=F1A133_DICPU|nr:uncharacterized protein DICPUDRAFT_158216 [Dictyostelium purpureum]EGC30096.1 hypothetical protein DICPUDRAFT_158216 [Dictyostelium purpureum]|eukprot:XP_003293383.1 hypothetical protein DICPUDRAFT_158216 [Dictyostelium purpureum]